MLAFALTSQAQTDSNVTTNGYIVSAYIWPSCHNDTMGQRVLWPQGTGEWEIIKKGNPRYVGHYQPKVPLWGYEMDNDPKVMERWINAATDNGVNTFAFDWYWFDGHDFLESTLNDGFLKARNNRKMNFYLMWANHNVARNYWNCHRYGEDNSPLWDGAVDWKNFKIIVQRVITKYFKQPNYLKFHGEPVFCIFSFDNLMKSFGNDPKETRRALDYFRAEARKAGLPGVHIQLMAPALPTKDYLEKIQYIGISSLTVYNWNPPRKLDYVEWGTDDLNRREVWSRECPIPYIPNATIGWDDSPRFPHKTEKDIVHLNRTPEAFAAFLQKARDYCDAHPNQPKMITIDAWNEWVEDAYLLPDVKWGYSYLDAVRQVMIENKYARYK